MSIVKYKIIRDPIYGYKRLDPLPTGEELAEFYQNKYYHLIRKGGRAPHLRRFMDGGESARSERAWFHTTLYSDILSIFNQYGTGRRILDVGCGTGELVSYLKDRDFDVVGIEPSADAAALAKSQGLVVYNYTLEDFVDFHTSNASDNFDAIIIINILEHVPEPVEMVRYIKKLLKPGAMLCVQVPNDFNELQLAAKDKLNKEPWWIAIPDHINYFDFSSLASLLESVGFEVVDSRGDFPMELFLLMGEDYVGNPDTGRKCHEKRISFELAISAQLRRRLYQKFAEIGIGRDCLVFGKLR